MEAEYHQAEKGLEPVVDIAGRRLRPLILGAIEVLSERAPLNTDKFIALRKAITEGTLQIVPRVFAGNTEEQQPSVSFGFLETSPEKAAQILLQDGVVPALFVSSSFIGDEPLETLNAPARTAVPVLQTQTEVFEYWSELRRQQDAYSTMPPEEVVAKNLSNTSDSPDNARVGEFIRGLPNDVLEQLLLNLAVAATYIDTFQGEAVPVEASFAKTGKPYFFQELSVVTEYWKKRLGFTSRDTFPHDTSSGGANISFSAFLYELTHAQIKSEEIRLQLLHDVYISRGSLGRRGEQVDQEILQLLRYKFCLFRAKFGPEIARRLQQEDATALAIFMDLLRSELNERKST